MNQQNNPQPPFTVPPRRPQPQLRFDFKQVTQPQWFVAGGGLVLFITTLLPWYSVQYLVKTTAVLGIQGGIGKVVCLISLLALLLCGLRIFHVTLPFRLAVADRIIYMGLAGEAVLLCLIYLLDNPGMVPTNFGYTAGPSAGVFLALLASAAIAVGGYLERR